MQLMKDHGLVKWPDPTAHFRTCDRGIIKVIKVAESVLDDDFEFHSWGNFVSSLLLARRPRDQFIGTDVMIVSAIG